MTNLPIAFFADCQSRFVFPFVLLVFVFSFILPASSSLCSVPVHRVFFFFFRYINTKGRMEERMQCGPISQLISHLSVIKLTVFKYSSTVLRKHKFNKTHFFGYICLVWYKYTHTLAHSDAWIVLLLRYRHPLVFTQHPDSTCFLSTV